MDERDAIAYIHQFVDLENPAARKRGPGFTLDGMRCLLDLLDHPERAYPSVVVAGSKGKGSTCALVASVLRAAGLRVGLFSQPHLHIWRERVRVNGRPLDPAALVMAVRGLQRVVPRLPERCPAIAQPTAYELGATVALLHFAAASVDLAVLEIGLGGRLDAINTVTPRVSAIAPISLEHTDVLGSTIAAIAGEKAGIIKPGVPVVVAPQPPEAAAVFDRVAAEHGAPLIWAAERCRVELNGSPDGPLALAGQQPVVVTLPPGLRSPGEPAERCLALPLLGAHQRENAATALAICEALAARGTPIPAAAVEAGLAAARWPGRLEVLQSAPIVVVDGAHNPESAGRLRKALAEHFPGRRLIVVLGVARDKDLDGIAAVLAPAADLVVATAASQARATPPEAVAAAIVRSGGVAETASDVPAALARALAAARPADLLCVTGSLMTVGEARAFFGRGAHDEELSE